MPRASLPPLKPVSRSLTTCRRPGSGYVLYDLDLDSDEEELSFEEQFILRMPLGEEASYARW